MRSFLGERCAPLLISAALIGSVACQRVPSSPEARGPNHRRADSATLPPEIDLSNCRDDRVARVGGADEAPILRTRVEPDFTESPGVKGVVIIETVIARDGHVCAARVLRGLTPAADVAALAAVRQWRFVPAKKLGQPVQTVFNITVPVGIPE